MQHSDTIIELYSEFRLPVTARVSGITLGIIGVVLCSAGSGLGILAASPFILGCLLPWGLYIRAEFNIHEQSIFTELSFFGIPLRKKREAVSVNHIALSRSVLKSGFRWGGTRMTSLSVSAAHYQYSVFIIYNDKERELVHSINDHEEAKQKALELARQMKVKVFDAISQPKKWIDAQTGAETIARISRRR